jgi:hypothetical protein
VVELCDDESALDDGAAGRDGWLLIAAAILQSFARAGDLAARLGTDQLALLKRDSPDKFARTASALHDRLRVAGISARAANAARRVINRNDTCHARNRRKRCPCVVNTETVLPAPLPRSLPDGTQPSLGRCLNLGKYGEYL